MSDYLFEIRKPNGDRYRIHPGGKIQRMDQPGFKPSATWLMLGLSDVRSNGRLDWRFYDLTPAWLAAHPLCDRNGKPRYTVCDLDHGTRRTWGNTEHHGVADIVFPPAREETWVH